MQYLQRTAARRASMRLASALAVVLISMVASAAHTAEAADNSAADSRAATSAVQHSGADAAAALVSGIFVFRNDPGGSATPIEVLIDGAPAGQTTAMSHLFKPLAPGKHLVASMGGARDTLEVVVQPGARAYLWQEIKPTYRSAPRTVLRLVGETEGQRAVAQTRLVTGQ